MLRNSVFILGCLLAAACGPSALQQSEANYKQCLAANSATPDNCEGLRRIYEIDNNESLKAEDDYERFSHTGQYAPGAPPPAVTAVPVIAYPTYEPR